ncbi:unnamed protein product [Rotaria sp. Silwood2]|nr:unnamed protein product [Rotaria sp. Silwood2]
MDKKQKQFDKLINEWKQKCEDITVELETSQKEEARHFSTELFKLITQYEESHEQIEALRKENRNLPDEIKDLIDQLSEGGKSVHELEKSRKRAELEKEELQAVLEDAEATLEQEEAKVLRAQMELSTKKKLESDINDLEVAVDHANRTNADLQKTLKRIQQNITELQTQIEEEQRQRDEACEAAAVAERRVNLITGELEELRTALEQAEHARKPAENELHDAVDRISDISTQNANLFSQRRQLESTIAAMQANLDEAVSELKNNKERAKKASADASRLVEELRQEQDHALQVERLRKGLEQQVKDLQTCLDEAEANSLKGGKRVIAKLEQRIHELENENELEQHRHQETLKELRRNDRRLKELAFQTQEDRKNQLRLQDLTEKLLRVVQKFWPRSFKFIKILSFESFIA